MNIWVDGLVASKTHLPKVQLSSDQGIFVQMSIAEARKIAMDILQIAARSEADAMLWKYFQAEEFPREACAALMIKFRDFRALLDQEEVEGGMHDPDTGEDLTRPG